jgi:hypothetical protein
MLWFGNAGGYRVVGESLNRSVVVALGGQQIYASGGREATTIDQPVDGDVDVTDTASCLLKAAARTSENDPAPRKVGLLRIDTYAIIPLPSQLYYGDG